MIVAVILASVGLMLKALLSIYVRVPARELKLRSKEGDGFAKQILLAANKGQSLVITARVLMSLVVALLCLQLFSTQPLIVAIILSWLYLVVIFALPLHKRSWSVTNALAAKAAALFAKLCDLLAPLYGLVLPSDYRLSQEYRVYNKDQLIDFLRKQTSFKGSRLSRESIGSLIAELDSKDAAVSDVMTKQKDMKVLKAKDEVGPILLSELHDSQQDAFLVNDEDGQIVGTASLRELASLREGGRVDRIVEREISYIPKDSSVREVISRYLDSSKTVYLVTNKEEKVCGTITLLQALKKCFDVS